MPLLQNYFVSSNKMIVSYLLPVAIQPAAEARGTMDDVERLLRAYPRIYFACHQRHVRDPEGEGTLSAHQASILSHLDPVDPSRVSDLAEHLGVTVSTMSLSIKRLARDGYVGRCPDPSDGRVVQLPLTEKGERVRAAQEVLEPDRVRALLGILDEPTRQEALGGIEMLAAAADELLRRPPADRTRTADPDREVL